MCISGSCAVRRRRARERMSIVHERGRATREETEMLEVEELEVSHPRVAGIVQTHRQQIDARTGRQQVRTRDIKR